MIFLLFKTVEPAAKIIQVELTFTQSLKIKTMLKNYLLLLFITLFASGANAQNIFTDTYGPHISFVDFKPCPCWFHGIWK